MSLIEQERQIIQQLIPQLEEDGYSVYIEPSETLLPPFLKGFRPDVIALANKPKRNIAIEILVEGRSSKEKLEKINKRFEGVDDWELKTYFVRPTSLAANPAAVSRDVIQKSVDEIEGLIDAKKLKAALLIAWATFEAMGRALLPHRFGSAQTPGRLVQVLAGDGYITPDEADLLRKLASVRNALIHGGLDSDIQEHELAKFLNVLKTLMSLPN